MKRVAWFEVALVLAILAIHLYAATSDAYNFPANWFTRDDAYYYFKVAQNITAGLGSTFDGINPTNGYHPLWLLVCIPIFLLAHFDLILPLRLLLLVQGGLSAATALLIYRLVKGTISQPLGILAATWWAFNLYIHNVMYEYGLETGLASFTTMLLVYQLWKFERNWRKSPFTRGQVAGLAIFALLALFSRLDLVFLVLLAGIWIILRGTPMRTLLLLDMLVAIVSVLASFVIRLGLPEYYPYSTAAITMIVISVLTRIVLYFFLELYQPPHTQSIVRTIRQVAVAVTGSSLLTGLAMLAVSTWVGGFPRIALLYDFAFNLIGTLLLRLLALLFSQNTNRTPLPPLEVLNTKWKQWLEEGLIYYGVTGGALGVYLLANKIFIGSAMPISGEIKRWWGNFGSRVYSGSARTPLSFWLVDFQNDFNVWRPLTSWLAKLSQWIAVQRGLYKPDNVYIILLGSVALLLLVIALLNRRKAVRAATQLGLPLLLSASIVQAISYNMTGYSSLKEWYWITEPLLLLLGVCLAAGILLRPFQKYPVFRLAQWVLVAAISLQTVYIFTAVTVERMPHGLYGPNLPYLDSVRFLEERTPAGAMIGMTGGGNVAYYIKDRTIVNMDGLINSPAYFEALKNGNGNAYMARIGLDYIFSNSSILAGPPYRSQFKTGAVVDRYGGKSLMEFLP